MLRLLLLRHAKADPEGKATDDHARHLIARGEDAARRMGAEMRKRGYEPALVLCSTSARTRETLEQVAGAFSRVPETRYQRGIYLAEWPALLAMVRAAPDVSPLLLVGHNPGFEQLAVALAGTPSSKAEQKRFDSMARKFPTAALAVLDFPGSAWPEAAAGGAQLTDFVRPKDLGVEENE